MSLETQLRIAGALQVLLALAHVAFPRRFGWKAELAPLSLFTRQVFWVHMIFIAATVGGFGVLTLCCAPELAGPGRLARALTGGLAGFWALRWVFQVFVYRPELWRGNPFNTVVHVAFVVFWSYLAGVYATAFARGF